MARNQKNVEACNLLSVAVSEIKRTGKVTITNAKALIRAHNALLAEPEPCRDDCLWAKEGRYQKCAVCARNYKRMKDLYERG